MQRWDIFCEVVDNYGDIGVCWRLAQQLAHEHEADVRLWVDRLDSFARLCPSVLIDAAEQRVGSITIRHWSSDFPIVDVADVVIEAFACELPETYITAMARRPVAPIWINLEYLSAEDWVEGCHLLPSPHPQWPLTKYFFFPGFTSKTGGLLRERNLLADRAAFDSAAEKAFWLGLNVPPRKGCEALRGIGFQPVEFTGKHDRLEAYPTKTSQPRTDDELRVSLFCYDNPALPELLQHWADGAIGVRVLAAHGSATEQIANWFGTDLSPGSTLRRGALTVHPLPFLPQPIYDRLLWACDVNFVRGEDSFVRAQWAKRPFVWQIYPQSERAHLVKLDAFLARYLDGFKGAEAVRRCWQSWNGAGGMPAAWPDFVTHRKCIQQHGSDWGSQLDRLGDLANNLARFVQDK